MGVQLVVTRETWHVRYPSPFFSRALQRRVDSLSRQLAKMHGAMDSGKAPQQGTPSSPRAVLQAMSTRTQIQRDR